MTRHTCGCHSRAISGGSDSTPATRGYRPSPPAVSPIKGLIDFHTTRRPT